MSPQTGHTIVPLYGTGNIQAVPGDIIWQFDPIAADGASVGWNYLSAPEDGKKLVYRWWCDEELGTVFFHDHLFANTRQRHGLFGALIPATPIVHVGRDSDVIVRFVCAADKPRNHGFTLHGHAFREWPHRGGESPVLSSEGALSSGSVRSYRFKASSTPGDYLYRSSVFKWVVAQGAWGVLRVH